MDCTVSQVEQEQTQNGGLRQFRCVLTAQVTSRSHKQDSGVKEAKSSSALILVVAGVDAVTMWSSHVFIDSAGKYRKELSAAE